MPLSRQLWPMTDSCCSRMTASMELATRYITPDIIGSRGFPYQNLQSNFGYISCTREPT